MKSKYLLDLIATAQAVVSLDGPWYSSEQERRVKHLARSLDRYTHPEKRGECLGDGCEIHLIRTIVEGEPIPPQRSIHWNSKCPLYQPPTREDSMEVFEALFAKQRNG